MISPAFITNKQPNASALLLFGHGLEKSYRGEEGQFAAPQSDEQVSPFFKRALSN
jgi:hypothetical protein